MARLPRGLNLFFRSAATSATRLSAPAEVVRDERSELAEERLRLEQRLALLRDAIQTLEAAPANRTATALLEKYRRNERQLVAEARALGAREWRAEAAGLGAGVMTPG